MYNEVKVGILMTQPTACVYANESIDVIMDKFSKSNAWNLPVLENGKYVGFVSKSKLFNVYRKMLINFSEE